MLKRTLSSRRLLLTFKPYERKVTKNTTSGHQRPTSDMPSKWPIPGGPLMARHCVLAGWRPYDSRVIKRRQYFVHHCVSLSMNINPSLVLVQTRKTRPYITERLLMVRKELNQTKKQKQYFVSKYGSSIYI